MLRWVRPFIGIFAMLAILAGAGGGAWAAKAGHNCVGMASSMSMDDCLGGDSAAAPDCAALICASAQMVEPALYVFSSPLVIALSAQPISRNDMDRSGLRGPPDLRPPIA